jgi:hypothetical protein
VNRPLRISSVFLALAVAALPIVALAQEAPPSYGQPGPPSQDQVLKGRIASIDSKFAITVDDENGYSDNVQLHQGTVINPTGLTLAPGMTVTIAGYNAGGYFAANQIDTPYTYSGPPPTPAYYGPGWWYPGFAWGYGPSFSLFVNAGAPLVCVARPWYGYWYVNPYVRPWIGYRAPWGVPYGAYRNVTVNNYYGNAWHNNTTWNTGTPGGWQSAPDNGQGGGGRLNAQPGYGNEGRSRTLPPNELRSTAPGQAQLATRPGSGAAVPRQNGETTSPWSRFASGGPIRTSEPAAANAPSPSRGFFSGGAARTPPTGYSGASFYRAVAANAGRPPAAYGGGHSGGVSRGGGSHGGGGRR